MKKYLNNFYLKLIAIISMTFDHVGKVLLLFNPEDKSIVAIENIFSIIGRLAFPIFLFLIIEGFYHTKNIKKYFVRLGSLLGLISVTMLIVQFIPNFLPTTSLIKYGNIFIDLTLSLLFLFLINSEKLYIKLSAIIPITYFVFFIFLQNDTIKFNLEATKILAAFAPQYSFVTPVILVLFSLISIFRNYYYSSKSIHELTIKNSFEIETFDSRANIFSITIAFISILMTLLTFAQGLNLNTNFVTNTYFIFAILPIMFYNGELGKNNAFIKSAYYLYYPLSLGIIYLIGYLISIF